MPQRDTLAWRAAVRAGFASGLNSPIGSGPWVPGGWYPLRPAVFDSWRIWRKFDNVTLEISESLTRTKVQEHGPIHGSGPRSRQVDTRVQTYHFYGTAAAADVWRGVPADAPDGASMWYHNSATAFGHGLYDALGHIVIFGEQTTTDLLTQDFTPADGGPTDHRLITDTSVTSDANVTTSYTSDYTALAGMSTPCRMIVAETLHPPGAAFEDSTMLFPEEMDPDGAPGTEVYWTDVALSVLHGGVWSTSMVLTSGGPLTGYYGPNLDGIDNGDFFEDSFARSGTLLLTFS